MIKLGERIEFRNSDRYSHARDVTFDGNINLYGLLKEVNKMFRGYVIDVYIQDKTHATTLTSYDKIGVIDFDNIDFMASDKRRINQVRGARILFRSSVSQRAELRIVIDSEKEWDERIPLDQVLADMNNPLGGPAAQSARTYYYEHYATDEQKAKMDKDERRNMILIAVFSILLSAILVGSTAVTWYFQARG